jgi:hypothetical protein
MTKIIIIIDENGTFENALSDTEVELQVLQRGTDDSKIDTAESDLEVIE